ncbi:MAG TPA: DUF4279 domain-containing protein [Candidatus Omnitrophota bacterium]|mgnify:CR=1 FL=1|nr:DUF4279 domain-containing protein [Candidatus Omnitrophota bacterium]
MDEDEKWSSAAFVAISDSLSPDMIERIIGWPPTRSHKIGDPISSRSGATLRKQHYYSIQSMSDSTEPMEKHIDEIITPLEQKLENLKRLQGNADLCLFCGFSSGNGQGGFSLSPEMLARLSRLGLELVLDLYPPDVALDNIENSLT